MVESQHTHTRRLPSRLSDLCATDSSEQLFLKHTASFSFAMPYDKPESFIWIFLFFFFRTFYCVCCVMTRWSGVASYNEGSCPSAENRREQHRS